MRAYELLDVVRGVPESGKSVESSLIVFILFFWFMDERERGDERVLWWHCLFAMVCSLRPVVSSQRPPFWTS